MAEAEQAIQTLEAISKTSKSGEKKEILARGKDNFILKEIFQYAYHPDWIYGIKNIDAVESSKDRWDFFVSWEAFKQALDRIKRKEISGNAARDEVSKALSHSSEQKWLIQVLNKDLKIGLGIDEALKTLLREWRRACSISQRKAKE